ncbi:MAG: alkaline phosphatase family protein [Terriglobales bacterium]
MGHVPGRKYQCALLILVLIALTGCGGSASPAPSTTTTTGTGGGTGGNPASVQHVVIVVEENHSYGSVIGSASMPYLNGLASKYALATNYFADIHPSLPNYFMLTAGVPVTVDDSYTGTYDGANLASVVSGAGKTWKAYAESIPSAGYTGGDQYPYVKRHNPFAYFTSVLNDPKQVANMVPFTQFSADLAAGTLPSVSFVIPNLKNDAHDGSLAEADAWLQSNIGPLVNSAAFANTVLIVVFDEGDITDIEHLGGHVAMVVAGGPVKTGYQSSTFYQHQSTLRFMLDAIGVGSAPGAAASAPTMNEFLK